LISFNVCQLVRNVRRAHFSFKGPTVTLWKDSPREEAQGQASALSGMIDEMAVGTTAATLRREARDQRTISTDDTVNDAFSNAALVRSAERLNLVMPM
jgi:hypothetical protein